MSWPICSILLTQGSVKMSATQSKPRCDLKTNPLHQRSDHGSEFRSRTLGFNEELLCQAGLNSSNEPQLAETRHNSEQIFGTAKWASYCVKWPNDLSLLVKYLDTAIPLHGIHGSEIIEM